jgi:hypothetical protein
MLHVGLDLSRRRLDVCVLSDEGELAEELAAAPDPEGLRYLVSRLARHGELVRAVIESMTGARFIHDTLEQLGWDVLIADAQRVKGLAPLACKTDRVDSRVLAVLLHRDVVPAIWLPDPRVRAEREQARFRLHLVKHKSMPGHRIHATLMTFRHPLQHSLRRRPDGCFRARAITSGVAGGPFRVVMKALVSCDRGGGSLALRQLLLIGAERSTLAGAGGERVPRRAPSASARRAFGSWPRGAFRRS